MIEITSHSTEQTRAIARQLAARLQPGDIVALYGPLGAGKTTFVRGLAAGLGIDEREVSSPTFILCQEYEPLDLEHGMPLAHLDGYRLATSDELATIGWEELLERREGAIVVEWAERFGDELPAERIAVRLSHVDERTRRINIEASRSLVDRIESLPTATGNGATDESNTQSCPVCGTSVTEGAPTFPFCSDRCRLVDLGRWFNEGYRVSRSVEESDFDE
jgi:tRNA threonylcarbamoyladenosine biosynthesis protein TsaE